MGPFSMILLAICGVAFAGGGILLSKVLAKAVHNPQKGETYECGVPTQGRSWIQFNVGYYLFALLFLIFDVELVFLSVGGCGEGGRLVGLDSGGDLPVHLVSRLPVRA